MGLFWIIFTICLYLLPTGVAILRVHRNVGAIIALNVSLGWTLPGWVIALVWSFTNPPQIVVMPGRPDGRR